MRSPSKSGRCGRSSLRSRRIRSAYPSRSRSARCQACSTSENVPPGPGSRAASSSTPRAASLTKDENASSSSITPPRWSIAHLPRRGGAPHARRQRESVHPRLAQAVGLLEPLEIEDLREPRVSVEDGVTVEERLPFDGRQGQRLAEGVDEDGVRDL